MHVHVILPGGIFKQAIVRVEHLVGEEEEPFPKKQQRDL